MKSRKLIRKKRVVLGVLSLLFMPLHANALCLSACQSAPSQGPSFIGQQNNEQRQRSHNFGDNSTAILGDVNIRVGHERIDIGGMENSQHSVIDASINSTVILGNMQQ